MCIVSAVTDFHRNTWPEPGKFSISWEEYYEYHRLKKMAEELDKQLNQPDCVKPEVPAWEEELRKSVVEGKGLPPIEAE